MFKWLGSLIDSNEKEVKRLEPLVDRVNSLEPELQKASDEELQSVTAQLKSRLEAGETLDDILPEAFAAVREAARRRIGQRHYDVQLMGGITLHQGKIAEMKTGEGKTLVATLPLYLNALSGQGCHLVTVNDYLAKRDAQWMGPIYSALGLTVATIQHEASFIFDPQFDSGNVAWKHLKPISRQQAYAADITYGTNHEFGFDYLRDNMVVDLSQCVQRKLNYAIVDEVDNILIDEARTPLIISGAAEESTDRYAVFARLVREVKPEQDYKVDEKTRAVSLTDEGISKMEHMLRAEGMLKSPSIYDPANYSLTRYLEAALKAQVIFRRDRDYVVKDGQVIIVDEFTGRLMFGRRYSEGLHQAIEAKEHVKVQRENVTMATITLQNYFRMYQKLAGMTGTAATEHEEFAKIYKLDVVVIPTNKEMVRKDLTDQVYKSEDGKFNAVIEETETMHAAGRPVLIGTVSIEKSELLSEKLKRKGIAHQVLNAKYHEKEAAIIAQAGRPDAVTVATNMAGRGVDIILGGKPPEPEQYANGKEDAQYQKDRSTWEAEHKKVVDLGGLHIIGTEKHEARRIDNQLRGRSGRQGDPGGSRFYISLEDDILKRFGGDRIKGIMEWAGLDEETPIENSLVAKAIENSQVRVEGYHFDMRKHLVEYDDVVNKHREIIYAERQKILGGADLKTNIIDMLKEEVLNLVHVYLPGESAELGDPEGLLRDLGGIMPPPEGLTKEAIGEMTRVDVENALLEHLEKLYQDREQQFGADMRMLERLVMLRVIDSLWIEHLTAMENMRQGIGLRAVGNENPLVVYKREGHAQFEALMASIKYDVAHTIFHVTISRAKATPMAQQARQKEAVAAGKVGRNDPCPCGSGKKYKKCCGK
ncbi:MAG: preprotein translocase subunit SecA [Chloroflexi bacterium]|nr:preprotein translocase subunit SecA [Chloroflexota bacterium]